MFFPLHLHKRLFQKVMDCKSLLDALLEDDSATTRSDVTTVDRQPIAPVRCRHKVRAACGDRRKSQLRLYLSNDDILRLQTDEDRQSS